LELGGFAKFLWLFFLIVFPFLGILSYLIARGQGMSERQMDTAMRVQAQQDAYIRSVASSGPAPADQIASAKALLDSGGIRGLGVRGREGQGPGLSHSPRRRGAVAPFTHAPPHRTDEKGSVDGAGTP
jgi:hypothetical protein